VDIGFKGGPHNQLESKALALGTLPKLKLWTPSGLELNKI